MSASLSINDAGTWRNAKALHINDAGTWRVAKALYAYDNGTWRTVFVPAFASCGKSSSTVGGTVTFTLSVTTTNAYSISWRYRLNGGPWQTGATVNTTPGEQIDIDKTATAGTLVDFEVTPYVGAGGTGLLGPTVIV